MSKKGKWYVVVYSQRMNLVQCLLSVHLYCGHAPNKVCYIAFVKVCGCLLSILCMQVYTQLQRLLLCLSHKSTIRTIDKLGDGHDQAVIKWRNNLEQLMASNEVCRKLTTIS